MVSHGVCHQVCGKSWVISNKANLVLIQRLHVLLAKTVFDQAILEKGRLTHPLFSKKLLCWAEIDGHL